MATAQEIDAQIAALQTQIVILAINVSNAAILFSEGAF